MATKATKRAEDPTTVQRVAKLQLVLPLNCDWDTAGRALRAVRKACTFAANWEITSLLARDRGAFSCGTFSPEGEFVLPTRKKKNKKDKRGKLDIPKLAEAKGEASDYNLLRKACPFVSSSIVSNVAHHVERKYLQERFEHLILKRNAPYYRSFPIPIHNQRWHLEEQGQGFIIVFSLLSTDAQGFSDNDGKPLTQIRFVLDMRGLRGFEKKALEHFASLPRTPAGAKERHEISIQLNERSNKWMILIPYRRGINERDLIADRVMEVFPYGKASFLKCVHYAKPIPWTEDIEYTSVEKFHNWYHKHRAEISTKYRQDNRRGKPKVAAVGRGRRRALKNKEPLAKKYQCMARTFNQQRAAHIVRMALRWRCGQIKMVDMVTVGREHLVLGSWKYYELQQDIRKACEPQGIKLELVPDIIDELQAAFTANVVDKKGNAAADAA